MYSNINSATHSAKNTDINSSQIETGKKNEASDPTTTIKIKRSELSKSVPIKDIGQTDKNSIPTSIEPYVDKPSDIRKTYKGISIEPSIRYDRTSINDDAHLLLYTDEKKGINVDDARELILKKDRQDTEESAEGIVSEESKAESSTHTDPTNSGKNQASMNDIKRERERINTEIDRILNGGNQEIPQFTDEQVKKMVNPY